jgi:hypothetical protein
MRLFHCKYSLEGQGERHITNEWAFPVTKAAAILGKGHSALTQTNIKKARGVAQRYRARLLCARPWVPSSPGDEVRSAPCVS